MLTTWAITFFSAVALGSITQQQLGLLKSSQQPLELAPFAHDISNPTCPADSPVSCKAKGQFDKCCYEEALFLSTQFWNYYPAIGANDTFTLHGLWPDNCDGSFEQFCDNSMNVKNVSRILTEFGETELLDEMRKDWLNINHNDESLWLHEFNKHGTCVSSIKESCYHKFSNQYKHNQNVVDFFKVTVNLFKNLPTFQWLAEAGIHPSTEIDYTKSEIEGALRDKFGATPLIKCNRFNGIQEVWYFNSVKGSLLSQQFSSLESIVKSNCPETGIKFYPKGSLGKEPPSNNRPTRVHLKPSDQPGCLIRSGRWYVGGSCATYYLSKAPFGGYNLKTRSGPCALDQDGSLFCSRKTKPIQFQYDKLTGYLGVNGKSEWSADSVPQKYYWSKAFSGDDHDIKFHIKVALL